MQAIEDAFDRKASRVASNIGKVLGFTVGYKLASKETDAFHVKMFNGIGGGVVGGLAGLIIDRIIFKTKV